MKTTGLKIEFMVAVTLVVLSAPRFATSAIAPVIINKDFSKYYDSGVFVGGRVGPKAALASVRRVTLSPHKFGKSERILIQLGDEHTRIRDTRTDLRKNSFSTYFHMHLDSATRRLVIDLSRVQKTRVDEIDLDRIFRSSRFVKAVTLTMDPKDQSTNMTFDLKLPVQVRFRILESSSSQANCRIVMDLRDWPTKKSVIKP